MANIISNLETREKVIKNCWEYVLQNFHKMSESNRIRIILAVIHKDIPQKIEGDGLSQHNITQIIYPEGWKPKDATDILQDVPSRLPSQ